MAQALGEDQEAEEFFQFPTGQNKQFNKRSPDKKQVPQAGNTMQDLEMADVDEKELLEDVQLDDMFGKVFGVERVHLLHNSDRLQDVIEKV